MNKMQKTLIAVAVAATAGMSSQAMAGAIAFSYLKIDNFQLFNNGTGNQLSATDFSFLDIGNSSSASGTSSFGLGAATSANSGAAQFGGHDSLLACSGSCGGIAENTFTQTAGNNFGRGDTNGNDGSLLAGVSPTADFALVETVAEGRQDLSGFTTGQSGARSATEFTFTVANDTEFRLDFNATRELFAELHQDEVQAQASLSWNVTLVNVATDETILLWTPNGGAGGLLSSIGATEIADPFSLNQSVSVLNTGSSGVGPETGFFSLRATLGGGNLYRFSIGHTTQINTQAEKVPEPATLALLAAGLGMLSFARRRKQA